MYRIILSIIAITLLGTVKGQQEPHRTHESNKNKKIAYYDSLTFAQLQNQD
jgi:hypothetical protein